MRPYCRDSDPVPSGRVQGGCFVGATFSVELLVVESQLHGCGLCTGEVRHDPEAILQIMRNCFNITLDHGFRSLREHWRGNPR